MYNQRVTYWHSANGDIECYVDGDTMVAEVIYSEELGEQEIYGVCGEGISISILTQILKYLEQQ